MSYIDEKVDFLVDDMGGLILSALERDGMSDYVRSVRNALADYREDLANIIRESFKNGLAAGIKRACKKNAQPKESVRSTQ